jgi:hypothetical protein
MNGSDYNQIICNKFGIKKQKEIPSDEEFEELFDIWYKDHRFEDVCDLTIAKYAFIKGYLMSLYKEEIKNHRTIIIIP